ncbi:hypothetical protein [Aquimarina sp. 2201CG5-10]|uniref:hypothetical protein n=1 Tax=Aquimarina callyspongiae TaxID=3098150 RepID=UPI002AB47439|nr:hypothetical protein [Aquimarina sp. 2201CG5-10]MDY8138134.1 hypothetical protein [Aquimarina sp. 2201CG5-10]
MSTIRLYGSLELQQKKDNLNLKFVKPIFCKNEEEYYWISFKKSKLNPDVEINSHLESLIPYNLKDKVDLITEVIELIEYENMIFSRYYFLKINNEKIYGYAEEVLEELFDKFSMQDLKRLDPENSLIYFMIFNYDNEYLLHKYLPFFSKQEFIDILIQLFVDNELSENYLMEFSNLIEPLTIGVDHKLFNKFTVKDIKFLRKKLEQYRTSSLVINTIIRWNNNISEAEIIETDPLLGMENFQKDLLKKQNLEEYV